MTRIATILLILLGVLLLLQFYPKAPKNQSAQPTGYELEKTHAVPDPVLAILQYSCYDCHSNHTNYPWYSSLQPVSFWLNQHIEEGKDELNFSTFGSYSLRRQYHKLGEIAEQIEEDEMPLSSYTLIHRTARLNSTQKNMVSSWVTALRDSFQANYPVDSLKRKKRR